MVMIHDYVRSHIFSGLQSPVRTNPLLLLLSCSQSHHLFSMLVNWFSLFKSPIKTQQRKTYAAK